MKKHLKPRWRNWYRFILWMIAYPGIILSVAMIAAWYIDLEALYIKLGWMYMYHLSFWCCFGAITLIFEEFWHRFCE